jgi:hypothetical protein
LISSETEYRKAQQELEDLNRWLARLESEKVPDRKNLTRAGVRRMISRIQEEIAEYEARFAPGPPDSENAAEPDGGGTQRRVDQGD